MAFFAIIPAAGSGTRLSKKQPKQYAKLAGRPMLWHAVRAVCVPPVESVFVGVCVVRARGDKASAGCDGRAFKGRLEPLYCGGETRRDSVYNGLVAAMSAVEADDWILVHDAARPCLARKDLRNLVDECKGD